MLVISENSLVSYATNLSCFLDFLVARSPPIVTRVPDYLLLRIEEHVLNVNGNADVLNMRLWFLCLKSSK
ncbi:hypothetical protein Nepgr_017920 [Nepenthes gracilis]|uniref:Uncharacterized protein n=1 Tax=Nepenthes gracilis TaxID=150966 RepID=A0AAD3XTK1_NEPGR|nr:hypothetical protein Nepgr_017920 [Nepenthes gracilis]